MYEYFVCTFVCTFDQLGGPLCRISFISSHLGQRLTHNARKFNDFRVLARDKDASYYGIPVRTSAGIK